MIKYYSNRELSEKLDINLSRWKRWAREFLPPDPLGGLQSGYARQFHPNDAFTVFLGGYLVSSLRYTIPEARQIISDLTQWLYDKRYYHDLDEIAAPLEKIDRYVQEYSILIQKDKSVPGTTTDFSYFIRGILSDETAVYKGFSIRQNRYVEKRIPAQKKDPVQPADGIKLLNITQINAYFSKKLAL